MNLQQLRYIIAVNRFRNFAKAADSCNVSQPTLSAMLQKLEEELDIRIFDRTNRSVTPTTAGEKIIRQAENALMEIERIGEIVSEDKGQIGGGFRLSVGPTIAPYILPKFIRHYREMYPTVELSIQEMKVNFMIEALQRGELDAGMAISGNVCDGVLEIPLYAEKFMVYLAESCWRKLPVFKPENLEHENMWIMKDAQCLRDSAFSFCKARSKGTHIYEAGSITTLVHIVDENGGFTIIPEMHLPFLNDRQRENVRPIEGDYLSQRRVSLYVKEDYVRERMLNTITDTMKTFMPVFKPENLEHENMWIMKDAQCLRDSAFSFCKARSKGTHIYEAGSITTLVHIVDENGGFTIIPEMHLPFLNDRQRENVRPIEGDYLSQRRVSLYVKEDYVRERMLNTITDTMKTFMPAGMIGEGIMKYGIRL